MARYIGPKTKIARKFKEPIYGADKYFERKSQSARGKRTSKASEYGKQLQEQESIT